MTTPAATALIDIVKGASASKKKHVAGAGSFGVELAAASGKAAKASKLAAGQGKTPNEAQGGANTKTPTEVRNTSKTGPKDTGAVKAESIKVKGNGQESDGSEQMLAAMVQGETQTKTAEGAAAIGAKLGETRAAGRIKADGQHAAGKQQAGDAAAHAASAAPDSNAEHIGIEGGKAVAAKAGASKDGGKRAGGFEDLMAQHREGSSQATANHPNSHNATAAAGHANGQTNTSARAEASTQTQGVQDASQGQANALLRTTEASASSETFNPQLDAPTQARAVEHVAWSIARKSQSGEKSFEIRMDPAELGRVDVKLQVSDDGKVSATLTVERPETLDLLTRDSRALEQALKDSGLDVGSGALNFSLRDQNASNARSQSEKTGTGASVEDASKTQTAAPERVWFGMPQSAIDIKV